MLPPGCYLRDAARSLLQSISLAGRLTSGDLMQLQEQMADGRSEQARRATIHNLSALGYTERHNVGGQLTWCLTTRGRQALDVKSRAPKPKPKPADGGPPILAQQQRPPVDAAPPPTADQPGAGNTRRVRYSSGHVQLPIAPRSVFELGRFV